MCPHLGGYEVGAEVDGFGCKRWHCGIELLSSLYEYVLGF